MTSRPARFRVALTAAAAVMSCVSGENIDLGQNMSRADAGALTPDVAVGRGEADGSSGFDGTGGPDARGPALRATIAAVPAAICAGECADLSAAVTGGVEPQTYAWDHGLGQGPGPEHVCPDRTTTYSLTVTSADTQVTASATIAVNTCDAGAAPPADAAAPTSDATRPFCVSNPSFEGSSAIGRATPGLPPTAAPPGWQVCGGDPDINPSVTALPASDGNTYMGLTLGPIASATESIGTLLCAPLEAGATYSFSIDLGAGTPLAPQTPPGSTTLPLVLQIWGARTPCGREELLWTSPQITRPNAWARFCDAFVPSQAFSYLLLVPAAGSSPLSPGQWSYLLVDHMVPGALCK